MSVPYGEVAEKVVELLNAQVWSMPFTATKRYAPLFDKASLTTLSSSVVPGEVVRRNATMNHTDLWEVSVIVVLQQKADYTDTAAMDALVDLTFEVFDGMRNKVVDVPDTQWLSGELITPFDDEQLSRKIFLSAIRLTYLVQVEL